MFAVQIALRELNCRYCRKAQTWRYIQAELWANATAVRVLIRSVDSAGHAVRLSPAHRPMGLQWLQARLQARFVGVAACEMPHSGFAPECDASLCGSWLEAHALIFAGRLRRSGGEEVCA